MTEHRSEFFEPDGSVKPDTLRENPWLIYLIRAEQPYWNAERIGRMEDKKANAALDYTLKTLDLLEEYPELDDDLYTLIRTALCWSETAKGGNAEDRRRWRARGYELEIHNEAGAEIYADHVHVRSRETDPAYLLIRTHGLIGQYVRGECRLESSRPLTALRKIFSGERFCLLFETLNACIIRAVSETVWEQVRDEVRRAIRMLCENNVRELEPRERLKRLLPGADLSSASSFFPERVFPAFDLWYFESALTPFGISGAERLTETALEAAGEGVRHINYKPLADALYYDYEGRKHVNVYKQRIIEHWLKDPASYAQHVSADCRRMGSSLLIGVRFTPVCEKLIDFCVEAERSGLLRYEKSITILLDVFDFRRDTFDRLNNEDKYLAAMNDADGSTKKTILDYVVGKSALDVGSGGGVLLDELEARYPDMEIIGTDISANVIEVLNTRKREHGRRWTAEIHNFVDGPFPRRVDNVIFSSILHEIYSYTDRGRGKFDISSVETALKNAVQSLNPGGRIIIRDGVRTPGEAMLRIRFKTEEGLDFFRQFLRDFRGLDRLPMARKAASIDEEGRAVLTDINFGREFLYTYTWGSESFPHEIQECFGYYDAGEYRAALERLGMKVLRAQSLLENGYAAHLSPLVSLTDENGAEVPFPDSNIIVVAERPL